MIRLLLRQVLLIVAMLFVTSLTAFVILDSVGHYDWWGTSELARSAGVPANLADARDLPMVWNRSVTDARVRTLDDLALLAQPATAPAARARLLHRGTAALPTIVSHLRTLTGPSRLAALDVLASMAPAITGGEQPPNEPSAALDYWDRFDALRGLDFRNAYAHRLVQRIVDHESRNADEQLMRLGTFALAAVFEVLDDPIDSDGARRLTAALSTLTGLQIRVRADSSVTETRRVVDTWRAWWFAERLEYETLGETERFAGHFTQTRYGRWLTRAINGRLGISAVTHRTIVSELRERVPRSFFVEGLGGLLATALVVAFGGGAALRRRPVGTKLLDLVGALVPGLGAFVSVFLALTQLCAAPRPMGPHLRLIMEQWPQMFVAVALTTTVAILSLRRRRARVVLHAVRHEAESWAIESRHPKPLQVVRHGFRVGLASLLAPLSLSAFTLVLAALAVEPLVGVRGMAALSVFSVARLDGPWILIAVITLVPLWIVRRWTHGIMQWALGDPASRPAPPHSIVPVAPAPEDLDDGVYKDILTSGALRSNVPHVTAIEPIEDPSADAK